VDGETSSTKLTNNSDGRGGLVAEFNERAVNDATDVDDDELERSVDFEYEVSSPVCNLKTFL